MALPDLRINPYVTPYAPGPTQEFNSLIEQRINDYDVGAETADVLSYQNDSLMSSIAPFRGDRAIAESIMNNTRKQVQDWAAKGDYENLGRAIRKGARDFASSVNPLFQNQQRYSQYLTDMQNKLEKGEIGLDTYTRAKAHSTSSYKGLDADNIAGSYFQGFTPTNDINVTDKVNKFIEGMKANGDTTLIMGEDGSWVERKWEQLTPQEVASAAMAGLAGDSEFSSYAQSQATIGNSERVAREVSNAVAANAEKYGFSKGDKSLHFSPEYIYKDRQMQDFLRNVRSVPASSSYNIGSENIFELSGVSQDKSTGTLINKDYIDSKNGKLYKYVDENGNMVSKQEYLSSNLPKGGGQAIATNPEFGGTPSDLKYRPVEISQDEANELIEKPNELLKSMAAQRYLTNSVREGKISEETIRRYPDFVENYLRINESRYNNKEYKNKTIEEYENAQKDNKIIYGNRRFPISVLAGGTSTEEFTSIKDFELAANMLGSEVVVLDGIKGGLGNYKTGDRVDLNALEDKLAEEGYTFDKGVRLGGLFYNPGPSGQAGISNALHFKNKEGQTKTIEVASTVDDPQLQVIQDVYSAAYKGVPYQEIPTSYTGEYGGKFIVRTSTIPNQKGGYKFKSIVEVRDAQNNVQAQLPVEDFGDFYKNHFAPDMMNKYIAPKYTKK